MKPVRGTDERTMLRCLWAKAWPLGTAREPRYPAGDRSILDYLRYWACRSPKRAAYVAGTSVLSFEELDELSGRFSVLLIQQGIKVGGRVAVGLPNTLEFAIVFFGTLKAGCVHVPFNPLARGRDREYQLLDSGAEAVVASRSLVLKIRAEATTAPARVMFAVSDKGYEPSTVEVGDSPNAFPSIIDLAQALRLSCATRSTRDVHCEDPTALNYSSGTTGLPKGCVHTHGNMVYTAATSCTVSAPLSEDDVVLCIFPLWTIAGENLGLLFPVFSGATCVLLTSWDPTVFLAAVAARRVTATRMTVDHTLELMGRDDLARHDLSSLRQVNVSSLMTRLTVAHRRRWSEFTDTTLKESSWGMTETHSCDTFTTGMQEGDRDLSSEHIFVGLPMPGTEFTIRQLDTGERVPLGRVGEIWVKSPSMMTSYWQDTDATRIAFCDGWLRTGDLGVIDTAGYLSFAGRAKDVLKVHGISVSCSEIEGWVRQHPAVAAVGVVGRRDRKRGEVPVAFVRLTEPESTTLTEAELESWCWKNMTGHKVPEIRFVDALPLTATGKIRRSELRNTLEQEQG